ncbi:MAG: monovalent cation:proton antiporter-2 (CPA2) family protein [Pseudomonadota bacterium]
MYFLTDVIVYLAVAIVAVPLTKRLGLGSVLGYLLAGLIIGPSVLQLVTDVDTILHFSELGVVFLLFIIGLEIQPSRLWVLRKAVFGLGGAQVGLTGVLLTGIAMLAGLTLNTAICVGFGLALSSTAFTMQLLGERKELARRYGRSAFAVLLFQDIAVIPMLALLPLLATGGDMQLQPTAIAMAAGAMTALVVGGHLALRPVLRIIAGTQIRELLTAVALLVVIGSATLMYNVGLSMGLGAFIAGMLLADSEYRHQLETDIEPFKGLLLGLFFIAVGMSVNLNLIAERAGAIAASVIVLMTVKTLVLMMLGGRFDLRMDERVRLGLILSQGGEFGFVLFTAAVGSAVMERSLADFLIVVVSISMALTPVVMIAADAWIQRNNRVEAPDYDNIDGEDVDVILVSFGRFGQIIGRILLSKGIAFTALESSPEQVEVVRKFGNKVYFGDARRVDLLHAAGADKAKFLILAIDDMEASVEAAALIRQHFPHLRILARAHNRIHAHRLMDLGINDPVRDTLHSSLLVTRRLLTEMGLPEEEATHAVETFLEHDERYLRQQAAIRQDEKQLMQTAREAAADLATLLRRDTDQVRKAELKNEAPPSNET